MSAAGKTLTVYLAADLSRMNRGLNQAQGRLSRFGQSLGMGAGGMAAFGGAALAAGAAAAAFATHLAVDGVKAAIEDEKSLALLNNTLTNMGFKDAAGQVDELIGSMQSMFGVSEDTLRPALANLVRTTGDLTKSQDLLKLAMDISAGSGKSLDSVVKALQRAYDGNYGSLQKLGVNIDDTAMKSKDFDAITANLARTFAGSASTAANTLAGKMQRLQIAATEAQESFGKGFLDGLESATGGLQNMQSQLEQMNDALYTTGRVIAGVVIATFNDMRAKALLLGTGIAYIDKLWIGLLHTLRLIGDAEYAARDAAADANIAWGAQEVAISVNNSLLAWNSVFTSESTQKTEERDGWQNRLNRTIEETNDLLDLNTLSQSSANSAMDLGRGALQGMVNDLRDATAEFNNLIAARDSFANSLAQDIGRDVSLNGMFDEANPGQAVTDYFNASVDAANFSTGLADLAANLPQTTGAQKFITDIAAMGASGGQAFLAQLTPEIANNIVGQLDAAATTINGNAFLIANKFHGEGIEAAAQTLEGMNEAITKNERALMKLGRRLGEPIGAEIRASIAAAVEAAIQAAAGAGISIGIDTGRIKRKSASVTESDVANSIVRLISRADARQGSTAPGALA